MNAFVIADTTGPASPRCPWRRPSHSPYSSASSERGCYPPNPAPRSAPFPRSFAKFNRKVANPFMPKIAGSFGPFAIVRHRGRRTGRTYATPVLAFGTEDGLVVGVLYGTPRTG